MDDEVQGSPEDNPAEVGPAGPPAAGGGTAEPGPGTGGTGDRPGGGRQRRRGGRGRGGGAPAAGGERAGGGGGANNERTGGQRGGSRGGEAGGGARRSAEGRAGRPGGEGGRKRTGDGRSGAGGRGRPGEGRAGGGTRDGGDTRRPKPAPSHNLRLEVGGRGLELHCDTCDLVVGQLSAPQVRSAVEQAHRRHQGSLSWESAWIAVCRCGWKSGRLGQDAARKSLDEHVGGALRAAATARPD